MKTPDDDPGSPPRPRDAVPPLHERTGGQPAADAGRRLAGVIDQANQLPLRGDIRSTLFAGMSLCETTRQLATRAFLAALLADAGFHVLAADPLAEPGRDAQEITA
jgi:hypothetical protein